MNTETVQAVIQALYAYEEAARNGYTRLDGAEISKDIRTVITALESNATYTVGELIELLGITKTDTSYEWM